MSLHDAYARFTPFELLFPDPSEAEALSEAVAEESEGRGANPELLPAFVTMGAVTDFIRRIEGEDAPPDAIHQYGALAYHALHFARAGHPLYLLGAHAARYLVGGRGGDRPEPPAPAGYLQLPRHLFWIDDASGTPASVDGIFWKASVDGLLHVLLATGLRSDRTGLVVVPLPEAPIGQAAEWLDVDVRGDGTDFVNEMPGAELDGLYRFAAAGEVLKLLARFFAYANAVPDALVAEEPASADGADVGPAAGADGEPSTSGDDGAGPEPSSLSYVRVTLGE